MNNAGQNLEWQPEEGPTPLNVLADLASRLRATSSRKAKTDLVAEVLRRLRPDELEPAIGFMLASPRQGAIGIGWATVSATDTLTGADSHANSTDDGPVSIVDFDAVIDQLQTITGEGSVEARVQVLSGFLSRCESPTADYVRRVLTGDARQGALAGVLTEAVAKAAGVKAAQMRRGVMLQGDLGQAARVALVEGSEALAAIDLEVHRPIQPMLASTASSAAEAVEAIGESSVDWKLDGARIQVHTTRHSGNARTAIYTRNLNDVTGRLPTVLELVERLECESAVLDGEVLGFFADDERPQAFQDTMSTFGTHSGQPGSDSGLRPYFFDLMYLDGQSLIDLPLSDRLERLHDLLQRSGATAASIPSIITADPTQAEAHFTAAVEAGHEGVMVKGADGKYEAGRRGKSWRKVKPVHTLDLVVLGAEWGHGRRRGWLSNLHLGARHQQTGEFVMVGKTFKGLTDDLLTWQTERFLELQLSDRQITTNGTDGDDKRQGRNVVFVRPELVVEIALDGAQTSTRYSGGVALRFARVRRYREDKRPDEADTLDAVRALL